MKISEFFKEVSVRDPFLYRVGICMLILTVILIGPLLFDDRIVLGINPWIKPIKFCLSVAIYVFTFAWFLIYIKTHKRLKMCLSYLTGTMLVVEILIIIFQASRGVKSHFNNETLIDQVLFGIMGLGIGIVTLMIFIYFLTLLFGESSISGPYKLSILLGILIFLFGSWIGGVMISNESHTIGAADGSEGLVFLNWSREFGDLRIGHFLGLHSIQIIPISYFLLFSKIRNINFKYGLVIVSSLLYCLLILMIYNQAQAGFPLIPQ